MSLPLGSMCTRTMVVTLVQFWRKQRACRLIDLEACTVFLFGSSKPHLRADGGAAYAFSLLAQYAAMRDPGPRECHRGPVQGNTAS